VPLFSARMLVVFPDTAAFGFSFSLARAFLAVLLFPVIVPSSLFALRSLLVLAPLSFCISPVLLIQFNGSPCDLPLCFFPILMTLFFLARNLPQLLETMTTCFLRDVGFSVGWFCFSKSDTCHVFLFFRRLLQVPPFSCQTFSLPYLFRGDPPWKFHTNGCIPCLELSVATGYCSHLACFLRIPLNTLLLC